MVTWGLLSAVMALIWNEASFLIVRFLLGAAEAGFFPGIILFLTYLVPCGVSGWPSVREGVGLSCLGSLKILSWASSR